MVLWGEEPGAGIDLSLPLHTRHPLYLEDKVRFPLETWRWLDYLRDFDFAVGTRLHGNVAALLATPRPCCSRTTPARPSWRRTTACRAGRPWTSPRP